MIRQIQMGLGSRFFISWIMVCVLQGIFYGLPVFSHTLASPDDYMRLSRVRDILLGIKHPHWHEPRMGIDGTDIFWSPLIDQGLAGIAALLVPFLGLERALYATATIAPLLLTLPFLAAANVYTSHLTGVRNPLLLAILFIFLFKPMSYMFSPGVVDHHNLQLILQAATLALLIQAIGKDSPHAFRQAALAGICMATGLAIGIESVIWIPVAMIIPGIMWLRRGSSISHTALIMGVSLFIAAAALFFILIPSFRWNIKVCDGFSFISLAVALLPAIFWGILCLIPSAFTTPKRRVIIAALVALPLIAGFNILFPQCLTNPYAMTGTALEEAWLRYMDEALSAPSFFIMHWPTALWIYLPLIAAPATCLWVLRREQPDDPDLWMALLAATIAGLGLALLQVRFSTFATVIAIAPLIWLINNSPRLIQSGITCYKALTTKQRTLIDFTPLVAGVIFFAAGVWMQTATVPVKAPIKGNCSEQYAAKVLNQLNERHTIVAMVTSGPELLFRTRHHVLSAPYHRNEDGILAAYQILSATDERNARALIDQSGADILLVCAHHLPFWQKAARHGEPLAEKLMQNNLPSWVKKMDQNKEGTYKIFRISKDDE